MCNSCDVLTGVVMGYGGFILLMLLKDYLEDSIDRYRWRKFRRKQERKEAETRLEFDKRMGRCGMFEGIIRKRLKGA